MLPARAGLQAFPEFKCNIETPEKSSARNRKPP
jgi:hypothetical protein